MLGAYRSKNLCFVGKVGTGFDGHTLAQLARALRPLIRNSPPFIQPPREKNVTWLEPRLVAQIAYQEWTADQKLRQPVFLGLRDDKEPSEIVFRERRRGFHDIALSLMKKRARRSDRPIRSTPSRE